MRTRACKARTLQSAVRARVRRCDASSEAARDRPTPFAGPLGRPIHGSRRHTKSAVGEGANSRRRKKKSFAEEWRWAAPSRAGNGGAQRGPQRHAANADAGHRTAGKSEGEKKGDKERRVRVNGAGRAGANASTPSGQAARARGARAELGPRPSWWRRGDYIGHTYAGHRYIVMVQGRRRVGPRAHDHFAGSSARWLAVLCVRSRRGNGRECRAG